MSRLGTLIRNLFRTDRVERDLAAEVESWLELLEQEKRAAGLAPDEARRAARLELGGVEQLKEQVRTARAGALVDQCLQDLRYGARVLRRNPGFAVAAVLTLALGIGANSAIFSVVNGVLLRPLPYIDSERLVVLEGVQYRGEFLELQQRSRTLDLAAYEGPRPVSLTGEGEPVRFEGTGVTAGLFALLGVQAVLGRAFEPGDDGPGSEPVVILGHGLWRQRFGGDHGVLGRSLRLDGVTRRVVGVMPAGFHFPAPDTVLWTPTTIDPADRLQLWSTGFWMIGRLRPDATLEHARAEVAALAPQMRELFPWQMPPDYGARATAIPLRDRLVGDVRPTLLVLLGAVACVLLIACANVGNLLLARGLARQKELAIRSALGAHRSRLVRQIFTESSLIAALGGACGLLLAATALALLQAWAPASLPRLPEVAIDRRVLEFTMAITLLSAVIFGAAPALRATASTLQPALGDGGRGGVSRHRRRLAGALVAAEIALAVVLVIGAGLLTKSFWRLLQVDPGFRPDRLVAATVTPPEFRYRDVPARRAFYRDLLERLAAVPATGDAAVSDRLPFGGGNWGSVFIIEGRPDPAREGGDWPWSRVMAVASEEYLRVTGTPLLRGRGFTPADTAEGLPVVLVSDWLARRYWPDEDPIGRRIRFPGSAWHTIVGVVGDVKWEGLAEAPAGALYQPLGQGRAGAMRVLVRSNADPAIVATTVRTVVASLDPDTPVDDIRTMEQLIARSVERPRLAAVLVGAFAVLGLLLGAIGVYGVIADAVGQRRQEIGVRVALGATTGRVRAMILREGLVLALAGAGAGLAGALAVTRLLSALLYGVSPTDPLTFALVPLLLVAVALLASYVPARRATRIDPVAALRAD
jgi:putative ABC transport system permease protein